MQAVAPRAPDAENADSLVFARRDIFVAAKSKPTPRCAWVYTPIARLIGFVDFLAVFLRQIIFS